MNETSVEQSTEKPASKGVDAAASGSGCLGPLELEDLCSLIAAVAAGVADPADADAVSPGLSALMPKLIQRGDWLASTGGLHRTLQNTR